MSILENLVPPKSSDGNEEQPRHTGSVIVIDGMAVIQSMGKPTWVRTGRDLATHFLDRRSLESDEVHVIFDRYDLPNSLKEGTQFRQGCNRSMTYQITDDAVIEKITLKQLVGSNVKKESLSVSYP